MRSKVVQRLLRALITVLGAGIGAVLAAVALRLYGINNPEIQVSVGTIIWSYVGACIACAIVFFFLSKPIIRVCADLGNELEQRLDRMSVVQMTGCILGLVLGLLIAALLSQLVSFLGQSMFTTALTAILYVVLGATGWSIGWKRGKDVLALFTRDGGFRRRHRNADAVDDADTADAAEDGAALAVPKVLDTSVIIDGRILDVCRTGFVEGKLVVPQFVLDELRHVADSTDDLRRGRGRRGLDILKKMQSEPKISLQVEATDWDDTQEVDVKLLRLAKQMNAVIVTGDYNLNKVAAVAGVGVLNLNDLASALKPAVLPGEEMTVQVVKEGKEVGQGVAYRDDGTMIVIDGGRSFVGQTITVIVTTSLQTSAGRMIFAKIKG